MANGSNIPGDGVSNEPEKRPGAASGRSRGPKPELRQAERDAKAMKQQAKQDADTAKRGMKQDAKSAKQHVKEDVNKAKQHVKQDAKTATQHIKQDLEPGVQDAKNKTKGMGQRMKSRVKSRANKAVEAQKGRAANKIHEAGDRVGQKARSMEQQGGMKARAGRAARRTGDALDQSAQYLETHEVATIRDDVEGRIRQHPFLSVGAALGSGLLLGGMFSGEEEDHVDERDELPRDDRDHAVYRAEPRDTSRRSGMMDHVKGPLGRAVMSGISAMVAKKLNDRVQGGQQSAM